MVEAAIIPLASIEYHGVLPIETDYFVAECVSRLLSSELARRGVGAEVLLLPPLPYTVSLEHVGAGPTASASPETVARLLAELAQSLSASSGARVIYYPVFHGGVYYTAYTAARQVMAAGGPRVYVDSFPAFLEGFVRKRYGLEPVVLHADALEASILAFCGYWRGVRKASVEEVLDYEARLQARLRGTPSPWMHWDIEYPGEPVPGSPELGERIVEGYVGVFARLVENTYRRVA